MNRIIMPTLTVLALGAVVLSGCSTSTTVSAPASTASTSASSGTSAGQTTSSTASGLGTGVTSFLADNVTSHAQPDDADYDPSTASRITLGSQDVLISEPGTYILSGTLTDATITVNSTAEGKVRLVLDSVTLTSANGSPLVVTAADEVVLVLADGSTNTITDTSAHLKSDDPDEPNAAIFSMADLTIAGTGTLRVTSNNADAIASKDGLVVSSGTLALTAGDDGLRGKDYVIIEGGTIDVKSGGDAIKSTNETDDTVGLVMINAGSVSLNAGDDAIHAEGDLVVAGGELTVTSSVEGLEGANVVIAGGQTSIISSDDGLNTKSGTTATANGGAAGGPGGGQGGGPGGETSDGSQVVIVGGHLSVDSEGDGLDSNGTITMTGGEVVIAGPTRNDNGALDATSVTISGGSLIAAGSAGMVVTPSTSSTQGWVAISQNVSAGQTLELGDGATTLLSFQVTKPAASIIVSMPSITNAQTYQVSVDGTVTSSVTAGQASTGGGRAGAPR